jgi:hypothetical protein
MNRYAKYLKLLDVVDSSRYLWCTFTRIKATNVVMHSSDVLPITDEFFRRILAREKRLRQGAAVDG